MLDIRFIRDNQKEIEKMLEKRGVKLDLEHLFEIDDERLKLIKEVDALRHGRRIAAEKHDEEKGKEIKPKLSKLEDSLSSVQEEFKVKLLEVPNLVLDDVPIGDEKANKVLKKVGEIPKFGFTPRDHVEIGKSLDMIDIPRATKVSGSRFYYLKNDAVLLELALTRYVMNTLVKEGFTPVLPPVLIKKQITDGLGYWQAGGNENFYLIRDFEIGGSEKGEPLPLYLIGTGEHAVVPMHLDEVLEAGELPKRYIALSANFRREAGSYGKDTHGILRVHQFDKVEMVSFTKPQDDDKEHEFFLSMEEKLFGMLEIPYQVVKMCTGDLGAQAAKKYDLEAWMPGRGDWGGITSTSNTTDYQARRLGIRFRDKDGEVKFAHTLNGTAIATSRAIVAILENYYQEDGSVKIPEVLQKYCGFKEIKK